ncbi:MAG: hypothetical protein R6V04_10525 [bacterium]
MKRYIIVLIILFCGCISVRAQNGVEIFGYFESQIMGADINSKFYQLYTNKLRVDLALDPSDRISFGANFDYITYHGKTEWDILQFLSNRVVSSIPQELRGYYIMPFEDRVFLDNAYLTIHLSWLDLMIGKQQISLGTGYVWNPVDVFNIKDVLDPTYEQPGHNAVRFDIPLSYRFTLTALYSPGDTWQNSAKLIQFKGGISHFDFSLIAIEKQWIFHDYTDIDVAARYFTSLPQNRRLLGASTVGELFGLGVWAEFGYNFMEKTDDFHELVAGLDYTFDFQTYVMAEFYQNTLGKTDYHDYTINDWMRLFATEQKAISRNQIYLLVQHPVSDFVHLGLSAIHSISDGSLALVPTFTYSFSQTVDIMSYINVNFGDKGAVYSPLQGNGGLLRARIYF